ncbi:MAG: hypothetical protein U0531_21040, partial [Dehalococcoidia bacterium]
MTASATNVRLVTVLVADGNADRRASVLAMLRRAPDLAFHCVEVTTGEAALRRTAEGDIDCLLLEVRLLGIAWTDLL